MLALDIATRIRELRRALAKARLRVNWRLAETFGPLTDEEIDAEIAAVRTARLATTTPTRPSIR